MARGGLSSDPAKARRQLEALAKSASGAALEGINRRLEELGRSSANEPEPGDQEPKPGKSPTAAAVERVEYGKGGRTRRAKSGDSPAKRDRPAKPRRRAKQAPPGEPETVPEPQVSPALPGFLAGLLAPVVRPRGGER